MWEATLRVSFSFVQKHFLGQFPLLFLRASNHQLADRKIELNLLFNLSNLNSNFPLTLGHLNPFLNNPALGFSFPSTRLIKTAFPSRYERRTRTTGTSRYSYRFRLTTGAPGVYLCYFLIKYWQFHFHKIQTGKQTCLRIQPFLFAPRRQGRFARRNVYDSETEIPYWWRKICPEALIGRRSSYIVLPIVYEWQTKDKRPQRPSVNVINPLQNGK